MDTSNKINDVDEIFESFVKKKLQQLGIKRAAAKSLTNGTMNELEENVKSRLEKNLSQIHNELDTEDEPMAKRKKVKKEKKSKKKKEKKKKKKRSDATEEDDMGNSWQPIKEITIETKEDAHVKTSRNSNGNTEIKMKTENTRSNKTDVKSEQPDMKYSSVKNKNVQESINTKSVPESLDTSFGPALPPKKDIATIKKKIEMLKAKSQEEASEKSKIVETDAAVCRKDLSIPAKIEGTSTAKETEKKNRSSSLKRERSRSKSLKHSKHRSRHRTRSRSRSRSRRHSHRRSRSPRRHRSRSRERRQHRRRSSSTSRKRSKRVASPLISPEDKVRLLEIAKANALAQHKATYMVGSMSGMGQMVKNSSMSVDQLTEICKEISSGKEISSSELPLSKEDAVKMVEEAERIHHPYAVRDFPISINIKSKPIVSSVVIPPALSKPVSELSKEFPVSCGQQHRRKEVLESVYGKWETVAKDEATKKAVKELVTSDKVFVDTQPVEMDLSSLIADRISAARQLEDNPNSFDAKVKMQTAQQKLDDWTKSKQVPGQFTGSTSLQPMPKSELEGGKQAWVKQADFKNAKQVGGIGKCLLQKMGWKPGTPLGKTMVGQLEPLAVSIKSDRKGLSSFMELPASSNKKAKAAGHPGMSGPSATVKDLSNKHPVSALMEICSKRHWPAPQFSLVDPTDTKTFTFKVNVMHDEYIGQPASNKKLAKLTAATLALQCMGLIPRTPNPS